MSVEFIETSIQVFPELPQKCILDQNSDDNCDGSWNRTQRDRQNLSIFQHDLYRSPNVYSALPPCMAMYCLPLTW